MEYISLIFSSNDIGMCKCPKLPKIIKNIYITLNFPWPLSASSSTRLQTSTIQSNLTTRAEAFFVVVTFRVSPELFLSRTQRNNTRVTHQCCGGLRTTGWLGGVGSCGGLHGRFGVAVRRETLDVDLGHGQLVGDVVSVLNGRRL